MKPEIRTMESFPAIQFEAQGFLNGNFGEAAQDAFGRLQRYCTNHDMWRSTGLCLAIMPDDPSVTQPEHCRYIAAMQLREQRELPQDEGAALITVEPGKIAVFTHKGPYDTLWKTWQQVFSEWFPQSGLVSRQAPVYEIYINDPSSVAPEDLLTEICIPIE